MKLQIAGDLHLEFPANREWLEKNPLVPCADVLLLAGDDGISEDTVHFLKAFKNTFAVKGNHNYYGKQLELQTGIIDSESYDAGPDSIVVVVDNWWFINKEHNVRFITTPLWTQLPEYLWKMCKNTFNDFKQIKNYSPAIHNRFHRNAVTYLSKALSEPHNGPTVVMTHTLPSYDLIQDKWRGDHRNCFFACELDRLILLHKPDLWICGHSHHCFDTRIHDTRIISNQIGYVHMNDHHDFNRSLCVEI